MPALQHWLDVVQRHRPASHTPDAQSLAVLQCRPLNWGSTPSALSVEHAMPVPLGEHALFDGVTRSARKSPSVSAMIGFSYQVHDERY